MGLMQRALETYETHARKLAGVEKAGKSVLAPLCHTIQKADVELTLDTEGNLTNAEKISEDTLIPATEDSAARSGKNAFQMVHPLCEQICHLTAEPNYYLPALERWEQSPYTHPILTAVLRYVSRGTLVADLQFFGVIVTEGKNAVSEDKYGKWLVRWRVNGLSPADGLGECWRNQRLQQCYIDYFMHENRDGETALCMLTGDTARPTSKHPKGIVRHQFGAKLVSANDTSGFTYRGRFTEDWQACTVGYPASQKAHNALRWVIANQGAVYGGRTFVCWNPAGEAVPRPTHALRVSSAPAAKTPSDYQKQLQEALKGWRSKFGGTENIVLAAFDAATTGRLAMTLYSEQMAETFLDRLEAWDNLCCWENWQFGIQSPSLPQIVNCAFGTQRTEQGRTALKCDERVIGQQLQRLISCRTEGGLFPADIEQALFHRASTPQAYEWTVWKSIVFTACAVIRKYRMERFKGEVWKMELDPSVKDRSYWFGCLLAVLEKAERDTYRDDEEREPNAMRLMSVYVQRPFQTFSNVELQLKKAYLPRLKVSERVRYEKLIGELVEKASGDGTQLNHPLRETYLLGYYLQKQVLYRPKAKKTENMEDSEDERTEEQD